MTSISQTAFQSYSAALFEKRIVSLWDMLQIDTRTFLSSLTYLSTFLGEHRSLQNLSSQSENFTAHLTFESRVHVIKAIQNLQEECAKHGLKTSEEIAKSTFESCGHALAGDNWSHQNNLQTVVTSIHGLLNATVTEAQSRQFYVLNNNITEQHDDADTLFGADVVDAFPNTAFDIAEAGKCLSFGLWTACVMHTMRILESGLQGLAQHVGIEPAENWNKTLNEIETALRAISKKTDGAEAEQWAAEAGTHLRFIKNAWRNQAMHHATKYDEREARAIFANAQTFMKHIAEKIQV